MTASPTDRNPVARDERDALDELIGPLTESAFFDTSWERAPVHISRPRDRDRFASLVSSARIESLLGTRELRFPDVQLSRAGDPIPPGSYTDASARVVPSRLLEHHADGATLVISGAHAQFDSLAALRRRAERALQLRCQTNVYLSAPARQGFQVHHDTHDVFVLQIEGRKRFDFHGGGLALPLASDRFDPAHHRAGEFAESVWLEPGDTLYIPRGVVHDAKAGEHQPSLHVTLGVFAVTVQAVLVEALQVLAERDVRLRRSLPRTHWLARTRTEADDTAATPVPEAAAADDAHTMSALLADALTEDRLSEALSRLRDELALDAVPDCRGRLAPEPDDANASSARVAPGLDATIVLRAEALLNAEWHDRVLRLRLFGQVIALEPALGRAFEWLAGRGRAGVRELPGLDDEQRLALVQRLWKANLVATASCGNADAACD